MHTKPICLNVSASQWLFRNHLVITDLIVKKTSRYFINYLHRVSISGYNFLLLYLTKATFYLAYSITYLSVTSCYTIQVNMTNYEKYNVIVYLPAFT